MKKVSKVEKFHKTVIFKKNPVESTVTTPVTIVVMGFIGMPVIISGIKNTNGEWKYSWEDDISSRDIKGNIKSFSSKKALNKYCNWDKMLSSLNKKHIIWISYVPIWIHPEHQQKVWEAVLDESKQIRSYESTIYDIKLWLKDIRNWAKLCFNQHAE